jgi:hypothetical protein
VLVVEDDAAVTSSMSYELGYRTPKRLADGAAGFCSPSRQI